jgi:hypothetical protein
MCPETPDGCWCFGVCVGRQPQPLQPLVHQQSSSSSSDNKRGAPLPRAFGKLHDDPDLQSLVDQYREVRIVTRRLHVISVCRTGKPR